MTKRPQDTSREEPDGKNPHNRFRGGPGLCSRPRLLNKAFHVCALAASLLPSVGRGAQLNLSTLTCDKYETQIMNPASAPAPTAASPDALNLLMWLFGFTVARSGAHVMYGNALPAFANGLDEQCKSHPAMSLLDAVAVVPLRRANPMDLSTLGCATFESRDADMRRTDIDSADTIMMWLFGFAVGKSGGHRLDAGALPKFRAALAAKCAELPKDSLFDALTAVRTAKPRG